MCGFFLLVCLQTSLGRMIPMGEKSLISHISVMHLPTSESGLESKTHPRLEA